MKHYLKLLCLLWMFLFAVPCLAKSWGNIFPLQTNRLGVLDMLGEPLYDTNDGEEYFEFENQKITLTWTRPDCYGEGTIKDKKLINSESLVYQITVLPEKPLKSIEIYKKQELTPKTKNEIYKDWLSQDVNCIGNAESGMSCSVSDSQTGFGSSSSKEGYYALYFFPTKEENKMRKEKLPTCPSLKAEM